MCIIAHKVHKHTCHFNKKSLHIFIWCDTLSIMKSTKYVLLFYVLIFILFQSILVYAEKAESKKIIFKWAFLYADETNTVKPIDYEKPTQVFTGRSRLKVYIKPVENVYIYLLHRDPDGNLTLLFPQKLKHFNEYYTPGKDYYIPSGEDWLHLTYKEVSKDPALSEDTFYFIASAGRLINLESLLKNYFAHIQDPAHKRAEYAQGVIEHIKKLRLEYSSFTPEKSEIVLIAGEFRGPGERIKFPALDIKADTFYAKTIRITY